MAQTFGFATFDPESGNGDKIVKVTGENYEGRVQRSITVQVATSGSEVTEQVVVNQKPVAEFVTIDESASIGKEGGKLTINGRSNSKVLTFSLQTEGATLELTIPATYTANGDATAVSGQEITGDPGATGAYEFLIEFDNIPANETVGALTTTLTVTTENTQSASCAITQNEGDPTLAVDTNTITLEADGSEKQLQITSNTDWTITQVVSGAFKAAVAAARAALKKK